MEKPLSLVSLVLSVAGTAVAGYLTYVHYNIDALVCGTGDCEIVQASKYSEISGIPIAIFGLLMYLAILALIIIRQTMTERADLASTGIVMLLIAGTIYAAYLTYLELEVIHAICQWCVISAIITVLLLVTEGTRMIRSWNTSPDISYEED